MPVSLAIVVLAVIQGLTEFLPVSSSGHLGLAQKWLGFNEPGVMLEVTTHAGTMLAVVVYYRHHLVRRVRGCVQGKRSDWGYVGLLAIGVLPVGIAGVCFKDPLEQAFDRPVLISVMLLLTGLILLSLYLVRRTREEPLTLWRALAVGLAQIGALLPGISRSGITITTARHLGVGRQAAAEFSLLMMLPAIGGAALLSAIDAVRHGLGNLTITHLALAFTVSALVGYGAICVLIRMLARDHFRWFGFYCLAIGILSLMLT